MSDISTGDFPEPRTRQEGYLQRIINNQTGGTDSGEFPEPRTRQEEYLQLIIKNQSSSGSGTNGVTFTPSVSSNGVISWTNDGGLANPESVNIKGPAGATGAKGDKGDTGDTGASVSAISLTKDSTGIITGGTAILSDGTSVPITITEESNE